MNKSDMITRSMSVAVCVLLFFSVYAQEKHGDLSNVRLTAESARERAEDFINKVIVQGGKAIVREIAEEEGMYKLTVEFGGQDYISYMTLDGNRFFQSGHNINDGLKKYEEEHTPVKSDKPRVELYVMSHCPFGTQIEKGMLPVLETLGDKIDFELKFCSYAMHQEVEIREQLREYCIQRESPEKLTTYLKCFLEEGNSEGCIKRAGVNAASNEACVAEVDKKFQVMEMWRDSSSWYMQKFPPFNIHREDNERYGIQGSPGIVINGKSLAADRDSQSLLSLVCSAFNQAPQECKTVLSSEAPAPGFGFSATPSATPVSCGKP